jgi:hypothetical protein
MKAANASEEVYIFETHESSLLQDTDKTHKQATGWAENLD